ncbi:MAG: glycosyltransferase family 4 protein [Gemmatimonadota bacterium]
MSQVARARVVHVVPTDRIAYYLLRVRLGHLRAAGFEITVVCGRAARGAGDPDYTAALRDDGLVVRTIPFARELAPRTDWQCARALFGEVRRGSCDIAHSHNPKGGLLGPPVTRLAGAPVVLHTVHGFLFNERTRGLARAAALAAERWTAAWCDHLLFQSAEDHAFAVAHRFKAPPRLHLIGNGIDEARFDPGRYVGARQATRRELGLADDALVVGMVGRLVREKGFEEFYAMAARVAAAEPRARFLVVGITEADQSDAVDPHQLAARYGLSDRCRVLEQRADMPELYLAMDVAVLPSHREGIPRALMEASAMGLPAVATDIRGCREVVERGRGGLLFPVGDIDAFTGAVAGLLADAGARERMGRAGRQRILERFTEGGTAGRVAACYELALRSARRGRP